MATRLSHFLCVQHWKADSGPGTILIYVLVELGYSDLIVIEPQVY